MSRVGLALLCVALLGGCAWFDDMTQRRGVDTRIVLEPRQRMDFNRTSRRNSAGQRLEEYRCPAKHVMVCVDRGARFECECWRSGP